MRLLNKFYVKTNLLKLINQLDRVRYYYDKKNEFNKIGFSNILLKVIRGIILSIVKKRLILRSEHVKIISSSRLYGTGVIKLEKGVLLQCTAIRGVTLSENVSFGEYSQIRPSSLYGGYLGFGCKIGRNTTFGPFTYLGCAGFVEIGSHCSFGPRITIISEEHIFDDISNTLIKDSGVTRKGITIGNNCWVGANVVILDGAKIGDNVVIGANSLVKGEITTGSVVGGSPAKPLRRK